MRGKEGSGAFNTKFSRHWTFLQSNGVGVHKLSNKTTVLASEFGGMSGNVFILKDEDCKITPQL
jgi:hypothetical protein